MRKHVANPPLDTVVRAVQTATQQAAAKAVAAGHVVAGWENGKLTEYGPGGGGTKVPDGLKIRPLEAGDLGALLALYTHLHRSDDPLPGEEVVQAAWQELLANPRHSQFGGYVEDVLVSSCTLTVIPNLTRGCRPYGIIENVVTHAAHRNKGYGKAILAHTLSYAWSAGCYKVMLLTGKKDEATLRFYESAGFDPHEKQGFIAKPA